MRSVDAALQDTLDKLPPGWAWPRTPDSVTGRTLTPLAEEAVRFEQTAEAMLPEGQPGTSAKLLPDYERVLGPDSCIGPLASFADRQRSAQARWIAQGGASPAHFVAVAAALGRTITITEYRRSRFGRGFVPFVGDAWANTWQVNVAALNVTRFRFGVNRFGDRFAAWGDTILECTLRRLCPAHTTLLFAYFGPRGTGNWDQAVWDRDGWGA